MGYSLVLLLAVVLVMLSEIRCQSFSRSCSTVNGITTCTSESGQGNMAMSSSSSQVGNGGYYMDSRSGIGNTGTGFSRSSQASSGNMPPMNFPPMNFPPMYFPPMNFGFGNFGR